MATARFTLKTINAESTGFDNLTISKVNPNLLRGDSTSDAANAKRVCEAWADVINSLTEETYESTAYQVSYSVNEEVED